MSVVNGIVAITVAAAPSRCQIIPPIAAAIASRDRLADLDVERMGDGLRSDELRGQATS